ncbi:hypothetical protein DL766_006959 [Monosporascus sp. MC13-8B]|uniref:ubiquitinyl hydrolase 1 n=1 Tax=Monosporascus cannonballus TaxID=155416 RepID=A0ABY0GY08_9PEZI|nr:hypothetical protein DL762_008931 [Monosporascus cannonballus]RYO79900.1 hypothetical protein DL763_009118 [Monosporascus cannonballus]RYP25634.1 hypothetical protein DL766_006959 [Monosporascus sp. MC13-8B]
MKRGGLPKKFLSRRDKNGNHQHRSSDGTTHKHRPLSAETFFGLFRFDGARRAANGETKHEKEAQTIAEIKRRAAGLELINLKDEHIQYVLNTKYAAGDVDKAIELLIIQQKSFAGTLLPYDPNVRMLGAENRGAVTCYLDALLFAMFAKLESFECMLKDESLDEAPRRLAALLRLWVNMLRSGKLIETDMTQYIQDSLAACGWREAQELEQQDTSEAFAFITETLQLPLLTLKVDLFHHGKKDDADHKVVYERLLNLGVPADAEGKGVKLEDCLEEYFNSRVDVLRDSLDEKKSGERPDIVSSPSTVDTPTTPTTTMRRGSGKNDQENVPPQPDENPEPPQLERRWTMASDTQGTGSQATMRPSRARTESIIQRVVLDERGKPAESDAASLFQRTKKRASVVKAVTIPAWQFFKLIPWHSPANKEPQSNLEVARHFSRRPVVGICLKRYMVDEYGNAKRQNTFIDIPDSLRLPHFIADERQAEENELSAEYKLVLQSVVCHRGESLHSGHYIAFCRVAPKLLTDNRRHDSDPPPDYEEAQWVKFDDLEVDQRVAPVDDIKKSLREEMPYLLFYQIVPVIEVAASSADGSETKPPSYDDTTLNVTFSEASGNSQDRPPVSRQASSTFENLSTLASTNASVRFSSELELPSRRSFADEDGFLSVSRRDSAAFVETSPNNSPALLPAGEESTTQRLSRAASKFRNGNKSRPQSQGGEGRISLTMSRLGGLVKTSKEPLRVESRDSTVVDTDDDCEGIGPTGSVEKEKEVTTTTTTTTTTSHSKRGKFKNRGEGKDGGRGLPERECVVQ